METTASPAPSGAVLAVAFPEGGAAALPPDAIVVAGAAASGKTTLATALARRVAYCLFDLDEVTGALTSAALELIGREEHALDEAGPGEALRDARYASLLDAAGANLAIGRGVVVAAPFTRELTDPAAWAATVARLSGVAGVGGAVADSAGELLDGGLRDLRVEVVLVDCPPAVVEARLRARGAPRDRLKLEAIARGEAPSRRASPVVDHHLLDGTRPTTDQVDLVVAELGFDDAPASPGRGTAMLSGPPRC